jgi:predicted transglutaminase-like protease
MSEEEKAERKLSYHFKIEKLYDAIYHSSEETVRGIASHLRKTFLRNHKSCLRRLVKIYIGL